MPVNPMQRRLKNSFLLGVLITVVIMMLVVLGLLYKMKGLKEEKAKIEALQKTMYVAAEDLESGDKVTMESFTMQKVQSTVSSDELISDDDFMFHDSEGEPVVKYNKDGSEKEKEMIMKINVPAGTIITKDMLTEVEDEVTDDQRILEYNMILLPSELEDGDYIDIRWSLAQGQDYIVLAKKRVLKTTETGIWLKLSEEEILTLNNAIVESYSAIGSKLYATPYSDPGMQEAAEVTYPVNSKVFELINSNPNIVEVAKKAIYDRYYANDMAQAKQRTNYIDAALAENEDTRTSNVESGNQSEISKIQAARADYVASLGQ